MSEVGRQEKPRLYRMGKLAERAGVSRQIVNTYCMYGLLKEAERTEGGHRLFDESSVRRIRLIRQLKARYSLAEINRIFIRDKK